MTSSFRDAQGLSLSGANGAALDHYERAADLLRCLSGDPVAAIDAAIDQAPGMPMAQVLKAWMFLLGTEPAALPDARALADTAQSLGGTERERAHAQATALAARGRWQDAGLVLEDIGVQWPTDTVALQAGHQVDFLRGDSRMLRDRIARALPHWPHDMPGYHAVLGMHAFGLEECGHYALAERQGRRAVALQARDAWAWHAVAHVHEMQGRSADGVAWLGGHRGVWSADSFLAVHNTWHLALFHLERDEVDTALALYDDAIGGPGSGVVFDLLDQSALLWRLMLRGVDAGDRWAALAERWSPMADAGNYVFNDMHAMMAFAMTGREADQARVLAAQDQAMARDDDNAMHTREIGRPATLAMQAFARGEHARSLALLRPIRHEAHRFGGSHAQRDLLDLTMIEAARRSGASALARALADERDAMRSVVEPA
jgi:hypothetical protein